MNASDCDSSHAPNWRSTASRNAAWCTSRTNAKSSIVAGRVVTCVMRLERQTRTGTIVRRGMAFSAPQRNLLRAKDLADARYFDPLTIDDLAREAGFSRAYFIRS